MAQITPAMNATILRTSLGLGAVGLLGAFAAHSDLLAIGPAWARMFIKLAEQGGETLSKDRAIKIASGVLTAATSFLGGMKLANSYFAYSGVGTVPAVLANAGTNGVLTWLAGKAWAHIVLEEDLDQSIESLISAIFGAIGNAIPKLS